MEACKPKLVNSILDIIGINLHRLGSLQISNTFYYPSFALKNKFCDIHFHISIVMLTLSDIWRPPNLSELTPILFNMGLTHLGLEASNIMCFIY